MGESVDFLKSLDEAMGLSEVDLREYSPLVLAYIGDAIYELIIRTVLVKKSLGSGGADREDPAVSD